MATTRQKTVLITGCTPGGIGAALCLEWQKRGYRVFATLRDPSKAAPWTKDQQTGQVEGKIEVLRLDVTSSQSIKDCVDLLRTKEIQALDVLVNNAGAMLIGPMLDTDLDQARALFEVNVWGLLAVTQAFAPLVVEAKGTILNISSIAGAVRMAWQGAYNGSKAAATFFSETLRLEMEPLGVRVVTAMVGEVETQIYRGGASYRLPEGSFYKSVEQYIIDQGSGKLQTNNEPAEQVACSLVGDVMAGTSGQTWRGGVAGTARVASWLLPGRLFEWMLHSNRGLYHVRPPKAVDRPS